ncbi:uncharacterized protein LOC123822519 [Phyllostomus hastatus]|uniref:uncharacterized protein LOC123822519 n=1 Tax=Phyllostomus hastatus TaxID=9423 RepID=UPI001E67E7C1|nr:uncharacterized protein LOC123822519 [Phyllostomus hastatus]
MRLRRQHSTHSPGEARCAGATVTTAAPPAVSSSLAGPQGQQHCQAAGVARCCHGAVSRRPLPGLSAVHLLREPLRGTAAPESPEGATGRRQPQKGVPDPGRLQPVCGIRGLPQGEQGRVEGPQAKEAVTHREGLGRSPGSWTLLRTGQNSQTQSDSRARAPRVADLLSAQKNTQGAGLFTGVLSQGALQSPSPVLPSDRSAPPAPGSTGGPALVGAWGGRSLRPQVLSGLRSAASKRFFPFLDFHFLICQRGFAATTFTKGSREAAEVRCGEAVSVR